MYCYKLNNSYTVYVNYAYYAEVAKICHGHQKPSNKTTKHKKKANTTPSAAKVVYKKPAPAPKWRPLPNNTVVNHAIFGIGKILNTNKDGYMSIMFGDKARTFVYPAAFTQGYLVCA